MNFILNVYDSSGVLVGPGPVYRVVDPEITERVDEVGDVSFSVPAGDERVGETLGAATAKEVELVYKPPGQNPVALGRALLQGGTKTLELRDNAYWYRHKLPSLLQELAWATTCPQHDYDGYLLSQMLSNDVISGDLKGLLHSDWGAVGWDMDTVNPNPTEIFEFNGETVLEAIRHMAEDLGYHFRETPGEVRKLDFGAFGGVVDQLILQATVATRDLRDNANVLVIKGLEIVEEYEDIINWLIPLGAVRSSTGYRLSLEWCSRVTPYTVSTLTDPNGNTRYYIEDTTSSSAYGERRQVYFRNDIESDSDDPADLEEASNMLYDRSVAYMQRRLSPVTSYRVDVVDPSGANHDNDLAPGAKVKIVYRGVATRHGTPYKFLDLNETIFVMSRTRRWGTDGKVNYTLELSDGEWVPGGNASVVRDLTVSVKRLVLTP